MSTVIPPIRLEPLRTACSSCNLKELCLPVGLGQADMEKLDGLISQRKAVPRGEPLFRASDGFHGLYAVRTGFFKTEDKRPTMVDNLRNAFTRANLSTQEIRTLRGVISSIDRAHLRHGRLARKPE